MTIATDNTVSVSVASTKSAYLVTKGKDYVQVLAELDTLMGTAGMRNLLYAASDADTWDRLLTLLEQVGSVSPRASVPNPNDPKESWAPDEYRQSILTGRTERSKRASEHHKAAVKAYKATLLAS